MGFFCHSSRLRRGKDRALKDRGFGRTKPPKFQNLASKPEQNCTNLEEPLPRVMGKLANLARQFFASFFISVLPVFFFVKFSDASFLPVFFFFGLPVFFLANVFSFFSVSQFFASFFFGFASFFFAN